MRCKLMKRYIKSARTTVSDILKILQDNGIDTTTNKYRLEARQYERYEIGEKYKINFTCNGDYLAYLSMLFHSKPTLKAIKDYWGIEEFKEFVAEHPTVEDIYDYAQEYWYGDGDDFILSLVNVSKNKVLYEEDDPYADVDDEEDSGYVFKHDEHFVNHPNAFGSISKEEFRSLPKVKSLHQLKEGDMLAISGQIVRVGMIYGDSIIMEYGKYLLEDISNRKLQKLIKSNELRFYTE